MLWRAQKCSFCIAALGAKIADPGSQLGHDGDRNIPTMSQRLEQQFLEIEKLAISLQKTAGAMAAAGKALLKAAKDGDAAAVEKALDRVKAVVAAAVAESEKASEALQLRGDQLERYLSTEYRSELLEFAKHNAVAIREVLGLLSAYPTTIRIAPKEHALVIDGRRTPVLRPSSVVALLKKNRDRSAAMPGDKFIETLYNAYNLVTGPEGRGQPQALSRLYEVLTLLPGVSSQYTEAAFIRDVSTLNFEGPHQTRSGARLSLPASTATKTQRGVYTAVGPDGEVTQYVGVQFTEANE